jgi:hypothetical protein
MYDQDIRAGMRAVAEQVKKTLEPLRRAASAEAQAGASAGELQECVAQTLAELDEMLASAIAGLREGAHVNGSDSDGASSLG